MDEEPPPQRKKFLVVGIITLPDFQKARFVVKRLRLSFPAIYEEPDIRPMLDVDWEEFLTKMQRKYADGVYALKNQLMIFCNDGLVGGYGELSKDIASRYRMSLNEDWHAIGSCHLVEYLRNIMGKFRQLVFIIFAIKKKAIGTMLFELYNDLVPLTCENFLRHCKDEVGGYAGTIVHRIVKCGWVQCGGFDLKEVKLPSENYVVPHNRRGVLSMCNAGSQKRNSTQFFVTLTPSPWMDGKYVAFGQLLHGADVLRRIEDVPTYYESPQENIDILSCGELTFNVESALGGDRFKLQDVPSGVLDELIGYPSKASVYSISKLKRGDYSLKTDLTHYTWPFVQLPDYLFSEKMRDVVVEADDSIDWRAMVDDDRSDYDSSGLAEEIFHEEFKAYLESPPKGPAGSDTTL